MTISTIQRPQQALSILSNGLAQFPASWQRTGILFTRASDGRVGVLPLVSGSDTQPAPGPATVTAAGGVYPTTFAGGETLTIGFDDSANFTVTFLVGDQSLAQVIAEINAANPGLTYADANAGQLRLTGIATYGSAQVRVVSGSAGVLAKLGLTVGTTTTDPVGRALTDESPPITDGPGGLVTNTNPDLAVDAYLQRENCTPRFAVKPGFPPHFVDVWFSRTPERGGSQPINHDVVLTLALHAYYAAIPNVTPSLWSGLAGRALFENEVLRIDLRESMGSVDWTSYAPSAIALVAMSAAGRTVPRGLYTCALVTAFAS
jgi:hypothetical protein